MVEIEISEGNFLSSIEENIMSGGVSFDHLLLERFFYDSPKYVTWGVLEDVK